ncbi:MAG: mechanosensitive ion channel [Myxococcota bacterium]
MTSLSVLRVALVVRARWVMVALALLSSAGVDVATLIAGTGVGNVAIALAVQGILSDLVASVVIVLDKPFRHRRRWPSSASSAHGREHRHEDRTAPEARAQQGDRVLA